MKTIKIIFSKHKKFSLFSSLIMFALNTPYSHVAIQMKSEETGNEMIYQASSLFVNTMCLNEFLETSDIIQSCEFELTDDAFKRAKNVAENNLGKAYDLIGVCGFAIQLSLGCIGISIKNPLANSSKLWCSEYATIIIESALGKEISDETDTDPKDLMEIIQKLPKVLE